MVCTKSRGMRRLDRDERGGLCPHSQPSPFVWKLNNVSLLYFHQMAKAINMKLHLVRRSMRGKQRYVNKHIVLGSSTTLCSSRKRSLKWASVVWLWPRILPSLPWRGFRSLTCLCYRALTLKRADCRISGEDLVPSLCG